MKRSGVISLLMISLLIISMTFVSAGWFSDLINKFDNDNSITAEVIREENFGFAGTQVASADYDGDGKADMAVYCDGSCSGEPDGSWYIMATTDGFNDTLVPFGYPGTQAASADYDGDGKADRAVYNPSDGTWYIMATTKGFDTPAPFGFAGTLAASADYDGDGLADRAVYCPKDCGVNNPGEGWWFIMQSKDGFKTEQFGWSESIPFPADYNGDGKAELAVYDPNDVEKKCGGNARWYIEGSGVTCFGGVATKPAPADYDGDGKADLATYSPSTGKWEILLADNIPNKPRINGFPSGPCIYGADCYNIGVKDIISDADNLELFWTYNYKYETPSKTYCDVGSVRNNLYECNEAEVGRLETSVSNPSETYISSIKIKDSSSRIIENVELKVAVWKNGLRSLWSDPITIDVEYNCNQNECTIVNEKNCTETIVSYKQCGNYDLDPCLEWGPAIACGAGEYCDSSLDMCVDAPGDHSCWAPQFCLINTPQNAIPSPSSGKCAVPSYACYACDTNSSWVETIERCIKDDCTKTCESNGGVCSNDLDVSNANINNSLKCCGYADNCFVCDVGYHGFEGECISNECGGDAPVDINNTVLGANLSLNGPALSWVYSDDTTIEACEWRCEVGRFKNETINGTFCSIGDGPFLVEPGCSVTCTGEGKISSDYEPINSVITGDETCSSNLTCYSCLAGKTWNGWGCVDMTRCDGCIYEGEDCLIKGFRLNIPELGNVFCDLENKFTLQKEGNALCQENSECVSNMCSNNVCIDIIELLKEQTNLIQEAVCWLRDLFNVETYSDCITTAAAS